MKDINKEELISIIICSTSFILGIITCITNLQY